MRPLILSLASLAALAVSLAAADAQPRKTAVYGRERTIVVTGRSFLDSGPQVPVGSLQNYVTTATLSRSTIINSFRPDAFGGDVLPNRFNNPGRAQPLVRFSTPAY